MSKILLTLRIRPQVTGDAFSTSDCPGSRQSVREPTRESNRREMLDKLKGNGITTWFLMANDEGHGYVKAKNQDFLFYATVRFVRQFLLGENVSTTANDAQSRNSNKQRSRSAFRLADRA